MSFEDDKLRWKDAARRILNLRQSSSDPSLNTNLNVILDELNSLDYATSVVDNEEVRVLKFYALSHQHFIKTFIITNVIKT